MVEISVNCHSLGVEVRRSRQVNDKLIPKNTQLPAVGGPALLHRERQPERVRVRILQGESPGGSVIPVGECWIEGLPPNLPKGSPVRVGCGVAANGRIEVTATDQTSGRAATAASTAPAASPTSECACATPSGSAGCEFFDRPCLGITLGR